MLGSILGINEMRVEHSHTLENSEVYHHVTLYNASESDPSDYQIRTKALELAVQSTVIGDYPEYIINKAKAFESYLKGTMNE